MAAGLAGLTLLAAPWQPAWPLVPVVLGAAVAATIASVAGRWLHLRGQQWAGLVLIGSGCAGILLTVLAAWSSEPLAVPVTLLATGALVAAAVDRGWPVLFAPVTTSLLVCVGAVSMSLGAGLADAALAVGVVGAIGLVALTALTLRAQARAAIAGVLVAAVLVAGTTVASSWTGDDLRWRLVLLTMSALISAVAVAADPRQVWPSWSRQAMSAAAVANAATAVWAAAGWWQQALPGLGWTAEAVLVALVAVVSAALRQKPSRYGTLAAPVEITLALLAAAVLAGGLLPEPRWTVLLPLAIAAAVIATTPERSWFGWIALLLGSGALWDRLWAADIAWVEAYSLPPAAVLAAAAWWRGRTGEWFRGSVTWACAITLVLPSAVAATTGTLWRPIVLTVAATLLLFLARNRSLALLAAVTAGLAALGPGLRGLREVILAETSADAWTLTAAALLAAVGWTLRDRDRAIRVVSAVAPVLLLVAGALLTDRGGFVGVVGLFRHLVAIGAAGALLLTTTMRNRDTKSTAVTMVVTCVLGAAAVAHGVLLDLPGPMELLTVPAAVFLVATGAITLVRDPKAGSWPWVGPGVLLALAPSFLLSLTGSAPLRLVLLALACAAVLLAGAHLRWQAPVALSAAILVVHALVQLSPYLGELYRAVPRWASLALIGALLLALGARLERRVANLRTLRTVIASYR